MAEEGRQRQVTDVRLEFVEQERDEAVGRCVEMSEEIERWQQRTHDAENACAKLREELRQKLGPTGLSSDMVIDVKVSPVKEGTPSRLQACSGVRTQAA